LWDTEAKSKNADKNKSTSRKENMDSIVVPIYKNRLVKLTRGTRIQGTNDKCGKIIRLTAEKACISWDIPNKAGVRLAYLFYSGIKCGLPTIQKEN
jgi:hypothetical protein